MKYDYPNEWKTYTGEIRHPHIFKTDSELIELVKQIRNRCDIFLAIQGNEGLNYAMPTILEDIYEDCQQVIDDYCIVGEDD